MSEQLLECCDSPPCVNIGRTHRYWIECLVCSTTTDILARRDMAVCNWTRMILRREKCSCGRGVDAYRDGHWVVSCDHCGHHVQGGPDPAKVMKLWREKHGPLYDIGVLCSCCGLPMTRSTLELAMGCIPCHRWVAA